MKKISITEAEVITENTLFYVDRKISPEMVF